MFDGDSSLFNSGVLQMAKDDIDEHLNEVSELKKQLDNLTTKSNFDSHQKEVQHTDETNKLKERHSTIFIEEKEKYDNLQARMDQRVRELLQLIDSKSQVCCM